MREIKDIIAAYQSAKVAGIQSVLATVVHVDGSSFRRPSARMLVQEDGVTTGAISGGCLEGDALKKALFALVKNTNTVVTYDTSDEDDAIVGAQLGCNGIIQVLFEPIPDRTITLLSKAVELDKPCAVVVLFNLEDKNAEQLGTQLLVEQTVQGELINRKLQQRLVNDAQSAIASKTSLFREYVVDKQSQHVFIEYYSPPISLVIVGAGNDVQGLAIMADTLGWRVTIADGRRTHAKAERFLPTCQIVVAKPEAIFESIALTEQTAVVLMTHNYQYDLAVLSYLLSEPEVAYVGILGPKTKYQLMLSDLAEQGVVPTKQQLANIYAPIGFEIGAETPEEIALSVLAEIKAVMSQANAKGGHLKDKPSPIHANNNTRFDRLTL